MNKFCMPIKPKKLMQLVSKQINRKDSSRYWAQLYVYPFW